MTERTGRRRPRRADRPPGTDRPKRFRPKFHWELIACGFRGHELLGTDAAEIRAQDSLFVVQTGDLRWYRCLRCDSWLPLPPPEHPTGGYLPDRNEVELPTRGRPLRDKFVLRLIALDRGLHFVILGLLSAGLILFAAHEDSLRAAFYRILADFQGGVAGPGEPSGGGILGELQRLFSLSDKRLAVTGAVIGVYALLEGVEAVGLWMMKRWAEYLTFIVTTSLLPLEIYELTVRVSAFKIIAFVVNLAIVMYLLFAKRLFGLRGGAAAEERERERDTGWEALERTAPRVTLEAGPFGQVEQELVPRPAMEQQAGAET